MTVKIPSLHKLAIGGDRQIAVFVYGTLILFVSMVVLTTVLFFQVSNAQSKANSIQTQENANSIAACNLNNANRTQDVKILRDILALPAVSDPQFITPANSAAQKAAVSAILHDIVAAYALRNCKALYDPK